MMNGGMMIYLTGAASSLKKSDTAPQNDPGKSLGGYVSSTPVANGDTNGLFDLVSAYTLEQRRRETVGLALMNTGTVPLTNVHLRMVVPPDGVATWRVAAVRLSEDLSMEQLTSRYNVPLNATFHRVDFTRAALTLKVTNPASVGEQIALLPWGIVVTVHDGETGWEGTWSAFERAFSGNDTWGIVRLDRCTYRIARLDERVYSRDEAEAFNARYITTRGFRAEWEGSVENAQTGDVVIVPLNTPLEVGAGIGLWIQRDLNSVRYRTNKQLIEDYKNHTVLPTVETVQLTVNYYDYTPEAYWNIDGVPTSIVRGGTFTLTINSNMAWTGAVRGRGATLDPTTASPGQTTVTVTTGDTTPDSITITFTDSQGVRHDYTVAVEEPEFSVDLPETILKGDTVEVEVDTNMAWTVEVRGDTEGITVTPNSGTGDGQITVAVDENYTGNAQIVFTDEFGNEYTYPLDIVAPQVTVPYLPSSMEAGDVYTVEVDSNVGWTVRTEGKITVQPTEGEAGQTQITVQVGEDVTMGDTAQIIFTDTLGNEYTYTVDLMSGKVVVSPETIDTAAPRGSAEITITTEDTWVIETDADWLNFSVRSGTGVGTVTVQWSANRNYTDTRTATITVRTAGGRTATVVITQTANYVIDEAWDAPVVTVEYADALIPASGGSAVPTVTTWTQVGRITAVLGEETVTVVDEGTLTYSGTYGRVDSASGAVTVSSRGTIEGDMIQVESVLAVVTAHGRVGCNDAAVAIYQAENKIESTAFDYGAVENVTLAYTPSVMPKEGGRVDPVLSYEQRRTTTVTYSSGATATATSTITQGATVLYTDTAGIVNTSTGEVYAAPAVSPVEPRTLTTVTATVTLNGSTATSNAYTIIQEAADSQITVTPVQVTIPVEGTDDTTIDVTSNDSWTVETIMN